nr:hypothetical protein [uncultured Chryseobacterium sp.]
MSLFIFNFDMRRFIVKIVVWLVCISFIGYALCSLSQYKFYGEYFVRQKINYFNQHNKKYNAIILGSSRMFRQINPMLLDSATSHRIRAYNMAAGGTFYTENRYIYRQMNIPDHIKYIFFEVQDLQPFDKNSYAEKVMYYHDFTTVGFELRYFTEEKNINSSFLSISHFFANIFYFKKLGSRDKTKNEFVSSNNGYFPLEKDYDEYENIRNLRQQYLRDTMVISKDNRYLEKEPRKKLNPALIQDIRILAEDCKKRGIKLILILPPFAQPTELNEIKKIIDTKVLDFSSRSTFKELYYSKNVYDIGHLSSSGSKAFTLKLADSLNHSIK